jgi:hypothetical protein
MRCSNCQADVPVTARFCPNCSHPVVKDQDIKSSKDVSTEWLKNILEAQEYNVEVNEKDSNMLLARHDKAPNLFFTFLPNINLISIETYFLLKKIGWGQKNQFLTALNKANGSHRICTFYATESMDSLAVSTFIYLTERISNRDVAAFLEFFNEGIFRTLEVSGLKDFG